MEEELDLRPYLRVLAQRWLWIAAAFALSAITTFLLFNARPARYESTAIIAYVAPSDVVQFDPRFAGTNAGSPLDAIPELATSTEILQQLLQAREWDEPVTVTDLRLSLSAATGRDRTLVHLTAVHNDPEQAAAIANAWAAVFVAWANGIYSKQGGQRLLFFQEQLEEAETALVSATDAWVTFNGINHSALISDTLSFYQQTRRGYLRQQQELENLRSSVSSFHRQIAAMPAGEDVSFADQLTFYQLQSRVLNDGQSTPIILQTGTDNDLIRAARSDYLLLAEGLLHTLSLKTEQLAQALVEIEPQILTLQQQRQQLLAEEFRLQKELEVARETVISLSYKVEEERITARDSSSGFRLASRAGLPQQPVYGRGFRLSLLAGLWGATAVIGFLLAQVWWRQMGLLEPEPVHDA